MALILAPGRCVPADFINPFLQYRLAPVACVLLLLVAAGALRRGTFGTRLATLRSALSYGALAAGVWSLLLTAWVWLQSIFFVAWCSPTRDTLRLQVQLYGATAIPLAVQGMLIFTGGMLAATLLLGLTRLLPRTTPATSA